MRKLQALRPQFAVTGHGPVMEGETLTKGLQELVENFETLAIPAHGKYVKPEDRA